MNSNKTSLKIIREPIMESPFKSKNGLERIAKAFGYSLAGLKLAYQHEAAIRQETWLMIVFLPLAFYVGHSNIERILLLGATLLVYIVELLNSAIETAVDHTSLEAHPLAGRAKDIGSAAVMIALINFIATWALVFFA
jgi:diacylglycerol kinase (ATP)